MSNYKTINKEAVVEEIIEKSRFIGYVKPVKTKEEAEQFIADIKKKHREASHNVPIYLLGEKFETQKYSDDGEPSGTAGLPVLRMLMNEGITDLVMVITRYFGGVKLGTGGLVRAYTKTAKSALISGEVVKVEEYCRFSIKIDYGLVEKLKKNILDKNIIIADTLFEESVTFIFNVLPGQVEELEILIRDMTKGLGKLEDLGTEYITAVINV